MARTWLAIQVDLVAGRGNSLWPRPGRIFAAACRHTFGDLADAIDDAFSRWDRSHLHEFTMTDGRRIGCLDWTDEPDDQLIDERRTTLGCLSAGEQFAYVFDFGDQWEHLCQVGDKRIDPLESLGIVPDLPLPCWGWGSIPDQYGRRWADDDGETAPPIDPKGADLPPLWPLWGPSTWLQQTPADSPPFIDTN